MNSIHREFTATVSKTLMMTCIKDVFWSHVSLFVGFPCWLTDYPNWTVTGNISKTVFGRLHQVDTFFLTNNVSFFIGLCGGIPNGGNSITLVTAGVDSDSGETGTPTETGLLACIEVETVSDAWTDVGSSTRCLRLLSFRTCCAISTARWMLPEQYRWSPLLQMYYGC